MDLTPMGFEWRASIAWFALLHKLYAFALKYQTASSTFPLAHYQPVTSDLACSPIVIAPK